jgi:hypothetical protein
MQLSTHRTPRRSYSPIGTVWRLGTVLLAALLMVLAQQAPASARALTEPSPYDFSVSISGPNPVAEYDDATYTAVPAYGTAPYTYTWYRGGTQVGTGPTYTAYFVRSSLTLQVNAVDAYGNTATGTLWVYMVPECRRC